MRDHWRQVKHDNKTDLATYTAQVTGVVIDPAALCDVMIKRFHEYKRQLLKLLHVVTLYQRIMDDPQADIVPRTTCSAARPRPPITPPSGS